MSWGDWRKELDMSKGTVLSCSQVAKGRMVTYGRIVLDDRPQKTEPERTRTTADRDRIKYPDDVRMPTANLTTSKVLINSTISTLGAKLFTMDVKTST